MNEREAAVDAVARSEAAAWLMRLQGPDVAEDEALAFDVWLDAAPSHRSAFRAMLDLGADVSGIVSPLLGQNQPAAANDNAAERLDA